MPDSTHKITFTRRVSASPADVYAAWTDPATMAKWLGKVDADLRVSGCYRFESPAPGGKTYVYTGEYLVLEPGRRIVQSFLAGEPNPNEANPYLNEFIEIRLNALRPGVTDLTFINGWDGEPIGEDGCAQTAEAWTQWLVRMEQSALGI